MTSGVINSCCDFCRGWASLLGAAHTGAAPVQTLMCISQMNSSKPGTGVFLPASCVLQAGNAHGDAAAEPSMPSNSRCSNPPARTKALTPPSPAAAGACRHPAAAAAAAGSSHRSSNGSWFNGMMFSPQLPPAAAATGGRHSLDALVEQRAAAASSIPGCSGSSSGSRYECSSTLLDVLAKSFSAAPMGAAAGQYTGLNCGSAVLAGIPPIPLSGTRSTTPYYSSNGLLASGQAGCGAAAGDLAQQMFQMQLANAAATCTPGLGAASQQCQQPTSFDGGLALMQHQLEQQQHQQQLQYQRQQHQQQRRYSCSLPLGERERYRMLGSAGSMSGLNSPLQPVLEEAHSAQLAAVQQEQLALESIEQELLQLMQAQQQHETGSPSLYGACSGITSTGFPAALRHSTFAEWPAAMPAQPAATQVPAALGCACPLPQTTALQTYMALHQQQQLGHQLCMQSVMGTRKQHGRLTAAAQVKLAQLLAVQQMQLQLQEELLLSLLPSNGSNVLQN